jgi:hypothetical protein
LKLPDANRTTAAPAESLAARSAGGEDQVGAVALARLKNSQSDFSLANALSASSHFYKTSLWKRKEAPLLRHFYFDA